MKNPMNKRQNILSVLMAGWCLCWSGWAADAAERWKQRDFIITFWCPPPATDDALTAVAAEGFNLTSAPAEGLDAVARHHLRAILTSDLLDPKTLEDDAKRAKLEELIQRVKSHPALEGYHITDEPGAGAFPGLGKLVAFIRERDPAHFAYINLFPTYANEEQLGVSAESAARARVGYPQNFAGVGTSDKTVLRYREHLKKYIEIVQPDLLSYDHYHFLKKADGSPTDGQQYFLNLALIRLSALEAHKPFLNIIQANTIEKSWRLPNPNELRWLVFTTMAYGGRGISYFTYWGPKAYNGLYQDGTRTPLVSDVTVLNQEIANFGPALMKLDSVATYQTAPLPLGSESIPATSPVQILGEGEFVLGLFSASGQTNAFMIVNRSYSQNAQAVVQVSIPGRKLLELDRKTGKWSKPIKIPLNRSFNIRLAPGNGRLFSVAK